MMDVDRFQRGEPDFLNRPMIGRFAVAEPQKSELIANGDPKLGKQLGKVMLDGSLGKLRVKAISSLRNPHAIDLAG
jgi:hypothetical protein